MRTNLETSPRPAERGMLVAAWAGYGALVLGAYGDSLIGLPRMGAWVYDHETLAAGLLALASALLGSWFLYRQSTQIERHEHDRWLSQREAVRVVLPLALSAISQYSVTSAQATKKLMDQCRADGSLPARAELDLPELPQLPIDATATIKEMTQFARPDELRAFSFLMSDIQVQVSRLAETIRNAGDSEIIMVRLNLVEYILDCAMIYARAGALFKFGRGASSTASDKITWQDVQGSLHSFRIFGEAYDDVYDTIKRRSKEQMDSIVADRWTSRD